MSTVAALTRARSWLMDVFVHHHAEQLRIARDAQRKQMGLSQQDYPYPGAVTGSNNPTVIHANTGWLKGALLGAALLTAGAGGSAAWLLKSAPPAAAPAAPAPPPAPASPAWDAVTEQQQPDGTWKEIKREHLSVPKEKRP